MNKEPITEEGLTILKKKLFFFRKIVKVKIIDSIKIAREFGDLKENAEYHAAKDELFLIDKKIKDIENKILNSEVIDIKSNYDFNFVRFGATVTLQNVENLSFFTYKIVGEYEADVDKNKISVKSPLVKSIILKEKNDIVILNILNKISKYKIVDIKYI